MSALAKALVAAQAAMPPVDEDGKGNYGAHMTLDHLIALTKPKLNEHGLALLQFPAISELGAPVLRTVILHESGEEMRTDTPLFMPRQDMQALGAAITYARRYAWASALGISSEKDDDADSIREPKKGSRPVSSPEAANVGANEGGVESRGAASPQGPHTPDAGDSPAAPTQSLELRAELVRLGKEYKKLVPDWKPVELQNWLLAKERSDSELRTQITRFRKRIADAQPSEFADKVPEAARV